MVRLKVKKDIDTLHNYALFQFQYGTIKRVSESGISIVLLSFNSNMVRLKGLRGFYNQMGKTSFNSNMVRLKVLILATKGK